MSASWSDARTAHVLPALVAISAALAAGTAGRADDADCGPGECGEVVLDEGDYAEADHAGGPTGGDEAGGRPSGPVDLLGRIHPLVVHFAIAWSVLALPLAILRLLKPQAGRTDLAVVAAATASAAAAVATGLIHAGPFESDPAMHALVESHEAAGIAALAILSVATAARIVLEKRWIPAIAWVYAALLGSLLVLVPLVGHLGGRITFGPDFLALP